MLRNTVSSGRTQGTEVKEDDVTNVARFQQSIGLGIFMNSCVGILPAAGIASRLRPFRYPKELMPVLFTRDVHSDRARPVVAAEYSLTAMREAGIVKCIVIINESKPEILKYFGNGSELGMNLMYAVQSKPTGLPHAINSVKDWIEGAHVCLALPDTVFRPRHAIVDICQEISHSNSDLVLGVFPTREPQSLGPVRVTSDGRVLEVQDKPVETDLKNTWGVAVWSPRFTTLLNERVCRWEEKGACAKEHPLGGVFDEAVRCGFSVRSVTYEKGDYIDIGKPEGIYSMIFDGSVSPYVD
jgi:glucose-1-phosphate thymidylyltransferase